LVVKFEIAERERFMRRMKLAAAGVVVVWELKGGGSGGSGGGAVVTVWGLIRSY
jgi:hypothetical protein